MKHINFKMKKWAWVGKIVFYFIQRMICITQKSEQEESFIITRDPNMLHRRTAVSFTVALTSLRGPQETRGMACFVLYIISPLPTSISTRTAQPRDTKGTLRSSNCKIHVNINTEKPASNTTAKEMFLSSVWRGSLGKATWSLKWCRSQQWVTEPKMGWILHKRNSANSHTHTPWAWDGFLSIASRIHP